MNNKEINNIKNREYSKGFEYVPKTYFYCGIIQCLVNIKLLINIFLNKHFLIDNKLIENSPITKKLYQIFQEKWHWTYNIKINDSLIYDINNEDANICKLLIFFFYYYICIMNKEKKIKQIL